ncbi:MAG: hypothetical protein ACI8RA_001853, partial [Chlamydiales bacterium]
LAPLPPTVETKEKLDAFVANCQKGREILLTYGTDLSQFPEAEKTLITKQKLSQDLDALISRARQQIENITEELSR